MAFHRASGEGPKQTKRARGPNVASDQGLSSLSGDVVDELRGEVAEGHRTEVVIAPGAHGNGPACLLLVADDEDVRDLLQRMLPYFIGDFLVPQIALDSKSLFLQRFGYFQGVIGRVFRDVEDACLDRRQPGGHRPGVMLEE